MLVIYKEFELLYTDNVYILYIYFLSFSGSDVCKRCNCLSIDLVCNGNPLNNAYHTSYSTVWSCNCVFFFFKVCLHLT